MRHGHRRDNAIPNRLWIARKRAGYPQKWVAALLGSPSLSLISEYEQGSKLPSFLSALKLELIYQTPLAELYPAVYGDLAAEVMAAKQAHPQMRGREEEARQARQWSVANLALPGDWEARSARLTLPAK